MARPAGKRMNGVAFRDVLLLKGWSLTEAADRSGIALTTLSGLAKGRHSASDKVIRQVCEALGVQDGTLFPAVVGWDYPEPIGVDEDAA